MTQPPPDQVPPADRQSSSPQPPDYGEDESALIPALLTVYAVYLLWRGAHSTFHGMSVVLRRELSLDALVGGVLSALANRALDRQRQSAGRSGDELWAHVDQAVAAAVEVGLAVLSEALLWTDQHTTGDPSTSDSGEAMPGEAEIPTREDPPDLLARMVATAVTNAAMLAAASLAGWSRKTWHTRQDLRVRDAHAALQGESQPLGEPFVTAGHKLMFPGDPAAPMALRANCRCWLTMTR